VYGPVAEKSDDKLEYLGIKLQYDRQNGTLDLSQSRYIDEMAEEYKLENTVKAVLPSTNAASINSRDTSDLIPEKEINSTYRKLLGKLLHLSVHTRPDISTVTSYLGQFAAKPTVDKYKCLIRCLQYVINTKDRCIRLKPDHTKLMGYSDASYNSNKMDSRSQTGYVLAFGKHGYVSSNSSKQKCVSTSACEAELMALHELAKLAVTIRRFMIEQGYPQGTTLLHCDNNAALHMAFNGCGSWKKSKHIDHKYYWVKEAIDDGRVEPVWVPTDKNVADLFTKHLDVTKFSEFSKIFMHGL
jgi:hypothetical protein